MFASEGTACLNTVAIFHYFFKIITLKQDFKYSRLPFTIANVYFVINYKYNLRKRYQDALSVEFTCQCSAHFLHNLLITKRSLIQLSKEHYVSNQ